MSIRENYFVTRKNEMMTFFLFTNSRVSTFDSRTVLTLMQFDAAVSFVHIELFLAQSEACANYFFSLLIFKKVLYGGNEVKRFYILFAPSLIRAIVQLHYKMLP